MLPVSPIKSEVELDGSCNCKCCIWPWKKKPVQVLEQSPIKLEVIEEEPPTKKPSPVSIELKEIITVEKVTAVFSLHKRNKSDPSQYGLKVEQKI